MVNDESAAKTCQQCGQEIDGDLMKPEGEGCMHTDCWRDWLAEQYGLPNSNESAGRTEQCIRCDDKISVDIDNFPERYRTLIFNHEASAVPICVECFHQVKDRDIF